MNDATSLETYAVAADKAWATIVNQPAIDDRASNINPILLT